MAKYEVNLRETYCGSWTVEADNEEDACDKFWDLIADGSIDLTRHMDLVDSETSADKIAECHAPA